MCLVPGFSPRAKASHRDLSCHRVGPDNGIGIGFGVWSWGAHHPRLAGVDEKGLRGLLLDEELRARQPVI